ncbi:MAG: hypothetical protein K2L78_04405, partial [Muribaculaceae bacterium]|nr:hypothetical protein [Muribaculaceae bacterium]
IRSCSLISTECGISPQQCRVWPNTRVYAKKQLTWLKRDASVVWLDPHNPDLVDEVLRRAGYPEQA